MVAIVQHQSNTKDNHGWTGEGLRDELYRCRSDRDISFQLQYRRRRQRRRYRPLTGPHLPYPLVCCSSTLASGECAPSHLHVLPPSSISGHWWLIGSGIGLIWGSPHAEFLSVCALPSRAILRHRWLKFLACNNSILARGVCTLSRFARPFSSFHTCGSS